MEKIDTRLLVVITFVFLAVFYILFPSRAYLGDDLNYGFVIERWGKCKDCTMFHICHLLYSLTGYVFFKTAKFLGLLSKGADFLTSMNSVIGILTLVIFYLLSYLITKERITRLLATLFLAVTIGFWGQVESASYHAMEYLFLIPAFFLMYKAIVTERKSDFFYAGIFAGLATLYFSSDILLIPIFLITYFIYRRKFNPKLTVFILPFVILVGCCYAFIILKYVGVASVYKSVTAVTRDDYLLFDLTSIPKVIYGQARTLFSLEPVKNILIGRYTIAVFSSLILLFLSVALSLYLFVDFCRAFRAIRNRYNLFSLLSLVWIAIYLVFFSWFSAGDTRFYTRNLIPASLLLAFLAQFSKKRRILVFILIVFLFLGNFFGQILPQSDIKYNDEIKFSRYILSLVSQDSLIFLPGTGESTLGCHLYYLYNMKNKSFRYVLSRHSEKFKDMVEKELRKKRRIFIVSDLRRITSGLIFKSLDQYKPQYAIEGEIIQRVLKENGYRLIFIDEYNEISNYRHNRIYELVRNIEGK